MMKTKMTLLLIIAIAINQFHVLSQESCKVLKPEISETYNGKCKNGLADGKGVASGKDKYEGKFKKGLPNGEGKYTWSTGEVYEGTWKEGKREGRGKYTFQPNGFDSIQYGTWKNDSFYKVIVPDPYAVYRSTGISRYSASRIGDEKKIMFALMQNGTNAYASGLGFYSTSGTRFSVGPKIGFENVEFPCTIKLSYTTLNKLKTASIQVDFEIKIIEPGFWDITINN